MGFNNMRALETDVMLAYELGFKYFAFKIEMIGFDEYEVIINPVENAIKKLEYIKNTYNADLTHKHSKGIRIVDSTFADTYEDIEWDFGYKEIVMDDNNVSFDDDEGDK